jgi:hypothetical protein
MHLPSYIAGCRDCENKWNCCRLHHGREWWVGVGAADPPLHGAQPLGSNATGHVDVSYGGFRARVNLYSDKASNLVGKYNHNQNSLLSTDYRPREPGPFGFRRTGDALRTRVGPPDRLQLEDCGQKFATMALGTVSADLCHRTPQMSDSQQSIFGTMCIVLSISDTGTISFPVSIPSHIHTNIIIYFHVLEWL